MAAGAARQTEGPRGAAAGRRRHTLLMESLLCVLWLRRFPARMTRDTWAALHCSPSSPSCPVTTSTSSWVPSRLSPPPPPRPKPDTSSTNLQKRSGSSWEPQKQVLPPPRWATWSHRWAGTWSPVSTMPLDHCLGPKLLLRTCPGREVEQVSEAQALRSSGPPPRTSRRPSLSPAQPAPSLGSRGVRPQAWSPRVTPPSRHPNCKACWFSSARPSNSHSEPLPAVPAFRLRQEALTPTWVPPTA